MVARLTALLELMTQSKPHVLIKPTYSIYRNTEYYPKLRLHGGVVVGSEISGGYRNLFVEDCKMDSPELDRVIRIKTSTCFESWR
jgi:Endopolygalacturonase